MLRENCSDSDKSRRNPATKLQKNEENDIQNNFKKVDSTYVKIKSVHTSFSSNNVEFHQNANLKIDVSLNITNVCHHENDKSIHNTDFESKHEENTNKFPLNSKDVELVEASLLDQVTCSIKQSHCSPFKSGKSYFKINLDRITFLYKQYNIILLSIFKSCFYLISRNRR